MPLSWLIGALVGLLTAGAAVGAGEAVAAFVRPESSPIIVVGNRFILLTPESVRRWAIRQFGTGDKAALLTGIYVVIAVLAVVLGILALRRLVFGLAGLGLFGAIGVYSALTTHAHRASDVIPTIVGLLLAGYVLWLLERAVNGDAGSSPGTGGLADRRLFLQGSVAIAGLAALAGFGGRALQHTRYDAGASRARIALPPVEAAAVPPGADLGQSGQPWATPSADFYRIDTALSVPQLDPNTWRLKIHGMVERELTLNYQQVLALPQIERWITLACVSREVSGPYDNLIGNARFQGTLLAEVLRKAGIQPGADQLVMRSVDGMTIGAPIAAIMDGRDALLAVGMNGQPLPVEHGFPVRTVIPGLYGYVSACKWVVDLEVTTFAAFDAYWVRAGWVQQGPVVLSSRIDRPEGSQSLTVGQQVPIAGVAWEQHVGVSKVEVQIDNGPWQAARLANVASVDTWCQWTLPWTPATSGPHTIRVRATDANGTGQLATNHEPFPSAATGLHEITVNAHA